MIDSEVTLLPEPDSPTRPITSPSRIVEVHPVDRLDHAVLGVEVGLQVPHLDQDRAATVCAVCHALSFAFVYWHGLELLD